MMEVQSSRRTSSLVIIAIFVLFNVCYHLKYLRTWTDGRTVNIPLHVEEAIATCRSLQLKPGPPLDFYDRTVSDRFQNGTRPILVKDARIWTGRVQGLETVHGDLLLVNGIIKAVGHVHRDHLNKLGDIHTIDAHGAWVTPGIIDVHSHLGVEPSPGLRGANDGNSFKGPILPWLRSVDGINTHDEGYASSIAGGVTTSLILPGSANAIGGQAFVIKLRPTDQRSPTAMLLESPFDRDSSTNASVRWRHMKHACGENPSGVYAGTRMDTIWAFRQAYNTARDIKESQDSYCSNALAGRWDRLAGKSFPESLQWEALVDVIRGRVKVHTHCYEAVDIDDFVRLSLEFQFSIAAFHHAHEAWLVPDVLKKAYGHPPAIAMFAAFARYKREAYRHSEFAPRVLADNDIDVIMKSDHPAIVSRYLIHEAAQAHYYGLADNIALASVISTPARVLGLDHRIGYIKEGFDADIVLWDSHPLALGATPTQVIIDGIPQLSSPHKISKPHSSQFSPHTPDFELEIAEAIDHAGLPPLGPLISRDGLVLFTNVSSLWIKTSDSLDLMDMFQSNLHGSPGSVVVSQGRIICHGMDSACAGYTLQDGAVVAVVDLQGGSLQPGLASVGSMLGLQEISMEQSTTDGEVYNVLDTDPPSIVGGVGYLPRAVDGLVYGTRDALLAYRAGVTVGITPPSLSSFVGGLSTAFSLGSLHKLESGAIVQETAALHVSLAHGDVPGVSTEIAALRRLLTQSTKGKLGESFQKVSKGQIPLVVAVNSADIIAALVNLKLEVEMKSGTTLKLTIIGGAEAHLLAAELAKANVGVILYPPRPLAYTWDHRRIIPGLPLSKESAIAHLISSGVTVGIGPQGTSGIPSISTWAARNLRFDAGWALLDSPHVLSKASALALASSNVEKLLGVEIDPYESDLVATSGGDLLSFEGKVVAVISPRKGRVDLF